MNSVLKYLINLWNVKTAKEIKLAEENVVEKIVVLSKIELRDIILSIQNNEEELNNFNDKYDYSDITNMRWMFYNCHSLRRIPHLNTSKVTDMNSMFFNCRYLKTIPLLNTSNVENMNSMFSNCKSLKEVPLLDISNVDNMELIFNGCDNLDEEIKKQFIQRKRKGESKLSEVEEVEEVNEINEEVEVNKVVEEVEAVSKRTRKTTKNQRKILEELINNASKEKESYSVKMDIEKIKILRKFFKTTGINASEFFESIIDFEELKRMIKEKEEIAAEVENKIEDNIVELVEETIKESEEINTENTEDKTFNYPKIKSALEVKTELKEIYKKDIDNKIEEIEIDIKEETKEDNIVEVKAAEVIEVKKTINKIIEISNIPEEKIVIATKEDLRDIILSIQNNNRELKNFNNKYDYSTITDMSYIFYRCESLKTIPKLDTSKVVDMGYMFCGCKSIKTIPQLDITSVTNIAAMFYGCTCLDKTIIKNIREEYYKKLVKLLNSESRESFKKNNGTWNCSKIKEVLKVDNDLVKRYDREFKTQKISSNKTTNILKPNIIETIKPEVVVLGLNSKTPVELISLYKEGKVSLKELIEYCKNLVKKENYPFVLELIMKKNYKDMLNEKDMLVIIKEVGKPTIKYIPDSLYKYGNSYEVMVKNMSEKYFKDNERLKVYKDNRVFN